MWRSLPSKESRQLVLHRSELPKAFQGKAFKGRLREWGFVGYVISWWSFLWLVGDQGIGSQHHQPSDSKRTGVYILVGNIQLTFSTSWGFQCLPKTCKDMLQNTMYGLWGVSEVPWHSLMAQPLLCFLAWLVFFLHFLRYLIHCTLWNLGKA